MEKINHKVGDTFVAHGIYKDANNNPVNLLTSGITIESSVKDPTINFKVDLDVIIDPDQVANPGMYTLTCQTEDWPISRLFWDIQYTQGTYRYSTETIMIRTEDSIT